MNAHLLICSELAPRSHAIRIVDMQIETVTCFFFKSSIDCLQSMVVNVNFEFNELRLSLTDNEVNVSLNVKFRKYATSTKISVSCEFVVARSKACYCSYYNKIKIMTVIWYSNHCSIL